MASLIALLMTMVWEFREIEYNLIYMIQTSTIQGKRKRIFGDFLVKGEELEDGNGYQLKKRS